MPTLEEERALPGAFQIQLRTCSEDPWLSATAQAVALTAQVTVQLATAKPVGITEANRDKFNALVAKWRRDTALMSSITKISMHPAYQAIIGMGECALPLIFEDMRTRGGHWLWALQAITQEDPARYISDFEQAKRVWLSWWESR